MQQVRETGKTKRHLHFFHIYEVDEEHDRCMRMALPLGRVGKSAVCLPVRKKRTHGAVELGEWEGVILYADAERPMTVPAAALVRHRATVREERVKEVKRAVLRAVDQLFPRELTTEVSLRRCPGCGREFWPASSRQRCCCRRCHERAYRRRTRP